MKQILVTGANGQLGRSIKKVKDQFPDTDLVFKTSKELDIADAIQVERIFRENNIDYCINCAAYTSVDMAEDEQIKAQKVNVEGVKNLAREAKNSGTTLVHISTDYVFDGTKDSPYTEEDEEYPVNFYGKTKLEGERIIRDLLKEHFIIRTSWLYSEFGNNFVKTMLRLANERDQIDVVNDQLGSPTYATDLALGIANIVKLRSDRYGTYHFSNKGITTWYDFAEEIFKLKKTKVHVKPVSTASYPTKAKRSPYSAMNTKKFEETFGWTIPEWKESLAKMLSL